MAKNILEVIKKTKSMAMEYLYGKMEKNMKENG